MKLPPNFKSAQRRKRGFTLVELVLVLTILAVLMGAAVYQLSQGGFFEAAVDTRVEGDVKAISTALQLYRAKAKRLPTTEQGLAVLTEKPAAGGQALMEELPQDPWGQPYKYRYPATKSKAEYDVYTVGKDGQDGTADDLGNWKAAEPAK